MKKNILFHFAGILLTQLLIMWFSAALFAQVNLQQGLVAYYPFNGNANDESGNGNHGVVYGANLTEDRFGNANSAYYMNGSAYINIGQLPQLNNADGLTISVWVKRHTSGRNEGFVGKWNSRQYSNNVFLLYNNEKSDVNNGGLWVQAKNATSTGLSGTNIIPPFEWMHIVGVWRNSDGFSGIFKNGINDGYVYCQQSVGKKLNYNTSYPAIIGNWGRFWGPNYFLIGKIDDIRIYNRALSEQEINALYTENQPSNTNTISNVLILQRLDGSGMVDVYFDLYGSTNPYNISLEVSFDGGSSYSAIPTSFLSGDVNNISPGTNKHIIWDGMGSFPNTYSTNTQIKIIANN